MKCEKTFQFKKAIRNSIVLFLLLLYGMHFSNLVQAKKKQVEIKEFRMAIDAMDRA